MDFRSNEAGRTEQEPKPGARPGEAPRGQTQFVDATDRGRRSFVTHYENRDAHSRLYRRAEALSRRLYAPACRSAGSAAVSAAAIRARRMPSRADLRPRTSRRRTGSPPPARSWSDQEKVKREEHPFDAYPRLKQQALDNAPPSPADNFRWRYYGLFYVAPAQDSYMCRLRIPNGIMKHWQFAGMADLPSACAARTATSPRARICRCAKFHPGMPWR